MNGDPHYALEKLGEAIDILATHPDTIRARLLEAAIHLAPLSADDFPETLRGDYVALMKRLTKNQPRQNEGSLWATIAHMRKKTMVDLAWKIVSLHAQLDELVEIESET